MPWEYEQRTGIWTAPNGQQFQGYSGKPPYKNDPLNEHRHYLGPIPRGRYIIDVSNPYHGNGGPLSLKLTPIGHNAHNRTNIVVHGDSIDAPGTASQGCPILNRAGRQLMIQLGDDELIVR